MKWRSNKTIASPNQSKLKSSLVGEMFADMEAKTKIHKFRNAIKGTKPGGQYIDCVGCGVNPRLIWVDIYHIYKAIWVRHPILAGRSDIGFCFLLFPSLSIRWANW